MLLIEKILYMWIGRSGTEGATLDLMGGNLKSELNLTLELTFANFHGSRGACRCVNF